MPHASIYVLASLISGVSTALILASGPSYTEPRSPQGTVYNVKRGHPTYDGCRASPCQIAYLNSVEDFCLWAPSQPALSATRNTEHTLVAWCTKSAHGTRLIPDGTILGARLVITPEYVQITGVGNLTNINVPANGVASAGGEGDRVHDLVFTSAYGQLEQIYDWTSFVSQERFCFIACKPSAAASAACPQIHDIFGCSENVPGNYDTGVFEDCIGDAIEVPSTLYQEVLAAPSHHSAHHFSSCTTRGTIGNAQATRARRAIAPMLVTSLSHSHFRSHSHSTSMTSSIAPTTTDTATTITFPSFPTSTSTATTFMNSSTPVSSNAPTSTPYSYNHTHTHSRSHWHTRTHRLSRNHPSMSSASASPSSSHYSFSHSPSSSSTAPSLNDPSSTSSASSLPISSTPSFTLTFSTYSSSDPSSGTLTSFVTSTSIPASTPTPTPTPSFPSSSFAGVSSSPSSSYDSSTPPSVATPTSSSPSPSTSSSTSSQSSYVLTFTTPWSSSVPTTSPASPSSFISPSASSSASSQSPHILTFTTPSLSSVPTASPATSSPTVPNSQTQIGSQCPPPLRVAVNAGSVVLSTPLLPLMLTVLMIVISSSVGVLLL